MFDLPSSWAFSGVIGPDLTRAEFFCASAASSDGAAPAVAASVPATSAPAAIIVTNDLRAARRRLPFLAIWSSPLQLSAGLRSGCGATGEQLGHVVVVEARLGVALGGPQRLFELGQRVLAPLGVWVVRGEHEQVRPRLLDHPSHRFTRERR